MKKFALIGAVIAAFSFSASAQAADQPIYYKAAPAFSWTGFYIGAHVGYGDGEASDGALTLGIDGVFGGVQIGYNWQLSRNWVFGLETDLSGSDIGAAGFTVDWFGTTRARLGYAMDQTLVYVTGGIAYGSTDAASSHIGYAVGLGLEFALSRSWSAKIEYLYVDLGEEVFALFAAPVSVDFHTVKFGVNYRF